MSKTMNKSSPEVHKRAVRLQGERERLLLRGIKRRYVCWFWNGAMPARTAAIPQIDRLLILPFLFGLYQLMHNCVRN